MTLNYAGHGAEVVLNWRAARQAREFDLDIR